VPLLNRELTEDEKRRVYDWALKTEGPKYPDARLTIVVADRTDFDGLARYTVVTTHTTIVRLEDMPADPNRTQGSGAITSHQKA
jgi:hypothetical protein